MTMDIVVVDTDVASFYFKNDRRAQPFVSRWSGKTLVISFMTFAELQLWALLRNWGPRRVGQLQAFIKTHFVVHPADEHLCSLWASVMAEARANGRPVNTSDAWIAATALAINAPLATHNAKDFGIVSGLRLLVTSP
jgi:tRNA(fMet)-specific endonuclease VapC